MLFNYTVYLIGQMQETASNRILVNVQIFVIIQTANYNEVLFREEFPWVFQISTTVHEKHSKERLFGTNIEKSNSINQMESLHRISLEQVWHNQNFWNVFTAFNITFVASECVITLLCFIDSFVPILCLSQLIPVQLQDSLHLFKNV